VFVHASLQPVVCGCNCGPAWGLARMTGPGQAQRTPEQSNQLLDVAPVLAPGGSRCPCVGVCAAGVPAGSLVVCVGVQYSEWLRGQPGAPGLCPELRRQYFCCCVHITQVCTRLERSSYAPGRSREVVHMHVRAQALQAAVSGSSPNWLDNLVRSHCGVWVCWRCCCTQYIFVSQIGQQVEGIPD
jgi:hypothetical protein